jgi:lysophospholipase L1-like esterase
MLRRLVSISTVAAAFVAFASVPAQASSGSPSYYLAVGDSLAAGHQPVPIPPPGKGYVDDVYASMLPSDPNLHLDNLGCVGETTTTMIKGGVCTYSGEASQLDAALAFLKAHRGHVKLITIDIGANDIDGCIVGTSVDTACVKAGDKTIARNLTQIVLRLRAAAPLVRTIALNYEDPALASYFDGPAGVAAAQQSIGITDTMNKLESVIYRVAGDHVADVSTAFATDDFTTMVTLAPGVTAPRDVANICTWTWMCVPPPAGPDIHPNNPGYAVMAATVEAEL